MTFDPSQQDDAPAEGVLAIPYEQLSTEALQGIIDDFVCREGTEYGWQEYSLEQKRQQVLQQLQSGKATLLFDPIQQSCHIALTDELKTITNS